MTQAWNAPSKNNGYLENHVTRLVESLAHWTGKRITDKELSTIEQARRLFEAPFVVISHNTDADPILNYGNQAALNLFEITWEELMALPSMRTAEPNERAERERLLATVTKQGYIENYRGIRISKSGRRFVIQQAMVWNLLDRAGAYYGQAAMFSDWKYLADGNWRQKGNS
jgi:benzoyl-CoA reductase/2-hydroxyglutaryl-CoA dehydratase subunit BcrC/BadD/HgdB